MQRERVTYPGRLRAPGHLARRLLPSPIDGLLIAVYLVSLGLPIFTADTWWRLRVGAWVVEHFDVPRENLFSFAAAHHPWIDHEWLTDALLFLVLDRVGPGWLLFLRGVVLAAVLALLYRLMRRRGGVVPAIVLTAAAAVGLLHHGELGPMLFAWLLLCALVTLIEDPAWRQGRTFVLVPLLFLLWANMHGSFLIGLVLLVAHGIGGLADSRRGRGNGNHLGHLVAAALSIPLTWCNPYYWSLYSMGIGELWQLLASVPLRLRLLPWSFVTLAGVLTCGAWLVIALAGRETRWRMVFPLILLTPLAWTMPAYLSLWIVWATPTMMEHLEQLAERIQHERTGYLEEIAGISRFMRRIAQPFAALSRFDRYLVHGNYAAMTMALALAYFSIPPGDTLAVLGTRVSGLTIDELVPEQSFPRGAVHALLGAAGVESSVMSSMSWGGYVMWEGYPRLMPFLDGRDAAYPLDVVEDYDLFASAGPGWEEILERYEVDYLLWGTSAFQVRALTAAGLWVPLYQDASSTVLGRKYPLGRVPAPGNEAETTFLLEENDTIDTLDVEEPTPVPVFGLFRPNRSGPDR